MTQERYLRACTRYLKPSLPQSVVQIFTEFFFRLVAPAADVLQLGLILQHDEQLPLVGGAQVRQNGRVAQVTCPILVLHKSKHIFIIIFFYLFGQYNILFLEK